MRKSIVISALILTSCAYTMQLMPRDSGNIYKGSVQSDWKGSGKLSVQIEDRFCSGQFVTAASNDSFGFFQSYGGRTATNGSVQTFGTSATYKALMTCTDNTGLRCDVEGGDTGAGICVDSNGKVYDLIYTPS
jgi:hypothetical protein